MWPNPNDLKLVNLTRTIFADSKPKKEASVIIRRLDDLLVAQDFIATADTNTYGLTVDGVYIYGKYNFPGRIFEHLLPDKREEVDNIPDFLNRELRNRRPHELVERIEQIEPGWGPGVCTLAIIKFYPFISKKVDFYYTREGEEQILLEIMPSNRSYPYCDKYTTSYVGRNGYCINMQVGPPQSFHSSEYCDESYKLYGSTAKINLNLGCRDKKKLRDIVRAIKRRS